MACRQSAIIVSQPWAVFHLGDIAMGGADASQCFLGIFVIGGAARPNNHHFADAEIVNDMLFGDAASSKYGSQILEGMRFIREWNLSTDIALVPLFMPSSR